MFSKPYLFLDRRAYLKSRNQASQVSCCLKFCIWMCIVFSRGIRNTETTITAVTAFKWDLRLWFHFFVSTVWYISRQVLWIFENVLWFVLLLDWSSCLLGLVVYCKAKSRQLIISRSWFERYLHYVANSWKDQAASQGGVVVSGWPQGRPSDVVVSAYVSSEIPLNSDEGTLTKSVILASSCFNCEELNWEFIVSNLISLLN